MLKHIKYKPIKVNLFLYSVKNAEILNKEVLNKSNEIKTSFPHFM
jgi:hypothetical protein